DLERRFLERVRAAMSASGFWAKHETTWACLDCELMPWSAKAQELLETQYAAVGAAGGASTSRAVSALEQAGGRLMAEERSKAEGLVARYRQHEQDVGRFVEAYRRYCWPGASLDDLKLAPFHLLATEGRVNTDRDHLWHVAALAKVCCEDPQMLKVTAHRVVDLADPASEAEAVAWWTAVTDAGGEGMVVKPLDFL